MPKIFLKKEDLIFMDVYPFWYFEKWGVVVGITCLIYKLFNYQVQYIGIYNVDV
jgi:hypothetical protein